MLSVERGFEFLLLFDLFPSFNTGATFSID